MSRPSIRVLVVLGRLALSVAPAQTSGRPLAIEDYYRVKTVGAPELSPDGKWVAYTVSTRVEATNGNTTEVWVAAFDGSTPPAQVGAPGDDATGPAWLDDGRRADAPSSSIRPHRAR